MRRLGRRAGQGLLVLAAVSVLSFALAEMAPGDFFAEMRLDPRLSESTLAALRARHGLDRPWQERYARWVLALMRGELGYSFAYGSPVAPLLWPRVGNTLLLTSTATLVAWVVAVPLGVWWARHAGGGLGRLLAVLSAALLALPDILLALVLLLVAVRTGWFPPGGMTSTGHESLSAAGRVADVAWHMVLPVVALVLAVAPALVRQVRGSMAEVLDAPFVRAARGHGLSEPRILFAHALPAAANPLITLFGLSVAGLLSLSLLVEVVMSWPGLGPLLVEAVLARDFYLVLGLVLASTVLLVLANLLADALLLAADPRIRAEER